MEVNASTVADGNKHRTIDHITKIEVTNGGTEKLFSMTGQELKALNFYQRGQVMPETAILFNGRYQRTNVMIPFGRFFKDPEFGVNLNAWDNVQIEITNDLTSAHCADKAATVDIQLLQAANDVASPNQYMKYYEWKSGKPAADEQYVYHNLPTTDPIAFLMCQTDPDLGSLGAVTNDPVSDSYNMKMTINDGKMVIWDHRPKDILRQNSLEYGSVVTQARYRASETVYYDTAIAYVQNLQAGWCKDADGAAADILETQESNNRCDVLQTVANVTQADMRAIGDGYYHTMVLHDCLRTDFADILDPVKGGNGQGEVKLEWYGYKDDHTLRTCIGSPTDQGAT